MVEIPAQAAAMAAAIEKDNARLKRPSAPAMLAPSPSEQLPSGPLLQRIPNNSSWRVNFSYDQDKQPAVDGKAPRAPARDDTFFLSGAPRTIVITRTNPRWLAVTTDVDGNKLEQWSDGSTQLVSGSGDNGTSPRGAFVLTKTTPTGQATDHMDFSTMDFPDMEWISKETFKGIQKNSERAFLVFENEGMTVWIDLESRFPILWKKEGETRSFEQLPAPTKMVELPAQAADLAKSIQKDMSRLKRPGKPVILPPRP
jgi:hypothetical protein